MRTSKLCDYHLKYLDRRKEVSDYDWNYIHQKPHSFQRTMSNTTHDIIQYIHVQYIHSSVGVGQCRVDSLLH